MKVEVLGSGCQKCTTLLDNVKQAVDRLGIQAELVKVTDIKQIMGYGVMTTPALVINGVIKSTGKIPSPDEIIAMLK